MRASAAVARIYAHGGFAVAIEGGIDPPLAGAALEAEGLAERAVGVILRPRLEVALDRNRSRAHKPFDTSILEGAMRRIERDLNEEAAQSGWHVIDNSDEPPERTVHRILALVG